jgi:hypothetical protein
VWTPVDFLDLGPRAAVDKALQRLAARQTITRIDRGLYYLSHQNSLTGKPTVPNQAAVIDAVSRRDQTRVLVDGLTAANDLGLTTAVPARVTVLTDARLRPITLGHQEIRFRTAAPSRLHWAGRPAMLIVQALYWLQDMLPSDRPRIIEQLQRILKDPTHGEMNGRRLPSAATCGTWARISARCRPVSTARKGSSAWGARTRSPSRVRRRSSVACSSATNVRSEPLANTENPLVRSPRGSLKFRGSATRCDGRKNCRQMSPLRSRVKRDGRLTATRQAVAGR